MRELYFDVWAGDDLLGTSLGELTDASEKKITVVDNGMGNGSFTISRHSAQYAMVTPGPAISEPLIRVRRVTGGPFAYDDTRYIHAFFVEEGDDVLVSPDEEGGEDATRSGRGVESILSRAVIDYEAHYVDDIVNHPYDRSALQDGQWHFDEEIPGSFMNVGTPGAVLRVLLRNADAQVPEPIPEVSHDFSVNNDSTSTPWTDGDAKWSFDVGTDLLSVLGILVNSDLNYRMTPALLLSAYIGPLGTDLSASITFTQAADIAEAGTRAIHGSPAKSRLLVKGATEPGNLKFRWVADTGIEAVLGVRQGSLDYQASSTNAILDKAGNKKLADLRTQHDGPPTLGVDEVAGQEAFIDYVPGDTVTVDIPGVFDVEPTRIHSITLTETDTGEVDVAIEFNGEAWMGMAPAFAGTGDGGGWDEFFRHDIPSEPQQIRFRTFGTGPLDMYNHIGAPDGVDGGPDSYIELDGEFGIDLNAYNLATAEVASIYLSGGEAAFEATYVMDFVLATTIDNCKYTFSGGYGIVYPFRTADPTGPQSSEGQVYWNSTSKVLRFYNGTTWSDIAAGAGAIGITIVDAKGDLIVGTANDAVDNLAAAANGASLITASGEATGLKWRLNKDDATVAPAVTDDSGDGYQVGSRWIDVTGDREYVLLDATVGAAVWSETSGTGLFEDSADVSEPRFRSPVTGIRDTTEVTRLTLGPTSAVLGFLAANSYLSIGATDAELSADGGASLYLAATAEFLGNGLRIPRLAADPTGATGLVYFNTASNTFRGFDGTAWGELALT